MNEEDYMTAEELRAHVKLMVSFLSDKQRDMTDKAIAIDTAQRIFDYWMRPNQTINHAHEKEAAAEFIMEAIKKAKRI
jgi:hypothetical protein